MSRKIREKSPTGMYHVLLRGINKQDIFLDEKDYFTMMQTLSIVRQYKGYMDQIRKDGCDIYAYCILPNHVHLVIKEGKINISKIMQKIEDSFARYYNNKYERIGPVFQSRFRSKPVTNEIQLCKLMRYIYRDPIKLNLCKRPEEYKYSSWREYFDIDNASYFICSTYKVLHIINYQELIHFVNEDIDDNCMDIDDEIPFINDEHAWKIISSLSKCDTPDEFKKLPATDQLEYIKQAYLRGISLRQAERLSSLTYYMIRKTITIMLEEGNY